MLDTIIIGVISGLIVSAVLAVLQLIYIYYIKTWADNLKRDIESLKVEAPGWFEYLKRYGLLYKELNAIKKPGNRWAISDAIGALKMIREAKEDIQEKAIFPIFHRKKLATLEVYEAEIIEYLNNNKVQIQDSDI